MGQGLKPRCQPAILKLLALGPLPVREIWPKVFCSSRTAYDVIERLHKERLAYIHSYVKGQTGPAVAVWALGDLPDAVRDSPVLDAERMQKSRQKMSVDDKDFLKARIRQRNRKIRIDPLTAAFFGGMR